MYKREPNPTARAKSSVHSDYKDELSLTEQQLQTNWSVQGQAHLLTDFVSSIESIFINMFNV